MKATTKILCALCALSFSLITFTACSSDDDLCDVNVLVGTWMHQDDDSRDYYQFNADGTGYEWEEPLTDIPGYQPMKQPLRYALAAGRLTIIEADGEADVERVKMVNHDCIKIDDDTYRRVK